MVDRDWLLILGGLLVIVVVVALAAVCSTSVLTGPCIKVRVTSRKVASLLAHTGNRPMASA
jgi:hypothetical protein